MLLPSDFWFTQKETEPGRNIENLKLDEIEKMTVKRILNKNNGNVTLAAKELGITRASLYRRIEKFGL